MVKILSTIIWTSKSGQYSLTKRLEFNHSFGQDLLRENTDPVRSNQRIRPTAPSVPLKLIGIAMLAACASRATETLSSTSFLMAALSHAGTSETTSLWESISTT
ncbi:hypothetical protein Tco_0988277 [Tanacetum coccineum]|uniref:Uncharacterized protein n=1 Tax=Tanacetum coccineum TaxID=301880 RepID=A0ABQ5ER82_9ASTR